MLSLHLAFISCIFIEINMFPLLKNLHYHQNKIFCKGHDKNLESLMFLLHLLLYLIIDLFNRNLMSSEMFIFNKHVKT